MKPVSTTFLWILFVWMSTIVVSGMLSPIPFIPALGESARNIFFHVPQSFTMLFLLIISGIQSYKWLKTQDPIHDMKAESSALVAMTFGLLTLITGAVWAELSWGTWWNWDPRQTTFLGLMLIYSAYFALRSSVDNTERKATLSAAYNLFAVSLSPFLIFVIPRLLPGLHPGAPEPGGANNPMISGIDLIMRIILYSSVIAFCMLSYWMYNITVRIKSIRQQIELEPS